MREALQHHSGGRLTEARLLYEVILKATPLHRDVLYFLGVLKHQVGKYEESAELMRRALDASPDQARCYTTLGLSLAELGRREEAEASFRRAISIDPSADRCQNLAAFLKGERRFAESLAVYRQAANLAPENAEIPDAIAEVYCDAGNALQSRGRLEEALEAYRRALEINAQMPRAWYAAGCAESSRKEHIAAMDCFQHALEISPEWSEAQHNLGQALFKLGQVDEALELFRKSAAGGNRELPESAIAVIIPGSPTSGNAEILEARRTWTAAHLPRTRDGEGRRAARAADGPLRVGYVSSFFQDHNWMKPVWGLINQHDRACIHVHLFSDAPASSIRHGYRPDARDRFHDISSLSNAAVSEEIERAGIDVLVDLNGYSNMARLALFAMRPAPVIIGWFNMFATTGMSCYDCLIGDDVVIPADEEQFYCEKIVRVPGSYLTFAVDYPVPEVVDPPCLNAGSITFGCLASQYKITSEVVGVWSRILERVPGSGFVLRNGALGSDGVREFVQSLFERRGIARDRLRLYGGTDHFHFLETYGEVDIALDTFPYNGGTTTTEAIWQGVPVVTFGGDRWVSRTSASILKAAGLDGLVANDVDGYLSLAVGLADSVDELVNLRRSMRARLIASPVCDTRQFARNMEQIYGSLTAMR